MKVMQILPRMNIGGVERGVLDLAGYLNGRGIKNIVVSGGGRLVEELNKVGVKHYELPVYKKSPVSLLLISRLRKIIEKEKVDIVHARSRVPAWISFFATRGTNTCFITTAHGVYRSRRLSKIMGWGKFVICPSKLVARHMRENFATPTEKIVTINRWVDLLKFKFTGYEARGESNIIVTMGRISPSKGYEHLIRAFRRVIRSNPYLILKIVGSVDQSKMNYFNYLKTLVSRFSLNYNIQFVGFRKDVENVLKGARILVVPSVIEESFGRVIVEAFACGVPVVASNIGALPEIIEDGRDGILVAPGDSEAISKAILDLLSNLQLAKDLAINARRKAERLYSLPQCTSRIEEVYKKTMELKRIMVIKTSSLGDLILIIPSLKAIKIKFPKSNVVLLTLKRYVSLFYDCPYVDKVIGLGNDYKKIKSILKITSESRRYGFDYIIDLQNSRTSHLIAFLSFAQKSFGFSRKLGFLLNSRVKFPKCGLIDPLTSQERILKCLGVEFKEKRLIFWNRKP
ncbi:MAG: glycosyltransferase, partial [Candidatus Omnitrophota bacterium]